MSFTMARPKKETKADFAQFGWRLEAKDISLLEELREFAELHRLSRNSALTIAVEKLLDAWKANNKARMF